MNPLAAAKETGKKKTVEILQERIKAKSAQIGVIGLGYVGLPLAVALAKAQFSVKGIDLDLERIRQLSSKRSYIGDVSDRELREALKGDRFKACSDFPIVSDLDAIIICVPTPINENKTPDLSFVRNATRQISEYLREGQLVILESTTYPGTTGEVLLPLLEASNLKVGQDFFLAYSPERVDPGNREFRIKNTPKVVGGITEECGKVARLLYESVAEQVILVSSPKVAETTKLFENVFRNVNIALVNELSILCRRMGISVWEVIDAATSKPFGFTRFEPGPGVGGHCIPVDPYYLATKAKEYDFHTRFIELSGEVNENMPYHVVDLINDALNSKEKALKGSKVLILGVTYKKDIDDLRESPALRIIRSLHEKGVNVYFNDPYVPSLQVNGKKLVSCPFNASSLELWDCVVIIADHSSYDYGEIVASCELVVDTRNATRHIEDPGGKIFRF
jgi:UDP-N-acetyl-D-glucosamine dehydrogenase